MRRQLQVLLCWPLIFALICSLRPSRTDNQQRIRLVASSLSSIPCSSRTSYPMSGWWLPENSDRRTAIAIYRDADLDVAWVASYVEPPPAGTQIPVWFHVIIDYWNYGMANVSLTCRGHESPGLAKEWSFRDGKEIGYVPATDSRCSTDPGW